jgi:hypothetical protein
MARPHKNKAPLEAVISFRLTKEDSLAYAAKVEESGMRKADFFRECVLGDRIQILGKPAEKKRILFLFNKSCKDIHQLSTQANQDHLAGRINDDTYEAMLRRLEMISLDIKEMIGHAD